MKVLDNKNIVKCSCGVILQYTDKDIKTVERGYSVQSYAGETYMAKIITCPKCKREIEVHIEI